MRGAVLPPIESRRSYSRFFAIIDMNGADSNTELVSVALWRDASHLFQRPSLKVVSSLCVFEIAFYIAYAYGMGFTTATASPFWIPDSILLCALLRSPKRYWWLFLLAPLPIRLFTNLPPIHPLWFMLGTYFVDSAKALFAALVLRRILHNPIRLETFRDLGWFGFVAVIVAPTMGAFAGATLRHTLGDDYWQSWSQWFVGDALAQIVVTPAILYWVIRDLSAIKRPSLGRALEIAVVFAGLTFSSYFAFHSSAQSRLPIGPIEYLPAPFLFWAAIRFGMPGASIALPIMTIICIDSAVSGTGIFAGYKSNQTVLQNFLLLRSVPLYLLAVLVEQRDQVERHLREGEKRFRTMANSAPVLIWMSGPDKLCTFFNHGWLEFTGRSLDAELGNGWVEGVHPDDVRKCFESYSSAFDLRRPFEIEYRLRRRDDQYRWILDLGVPRYELGGEFCGYIGSAIDITDRRQVEEGKQHLAHLQRLALVGELSAAIAHEIRQPLSAIFLNAGIAEKLLHTPGISLTEVEEIVADIKEDAHRAVDTMGRIRRFLRGREPNAEMGALDIIAIVTEGVRLISDEARKRRVKIEQDPLGDNLQVIGDRTQIMQVLVNLVLNGMDSMSNVPAGKRHLTLRTEKLDNFVRVSVADCGAGISSEAMPKLFESFFTTRQDGMGLGLSIAKSIIDAHGGRIWAENNKDQGSTFYFTLPVADTYEPPLATLQNS
jgi:PAS domain S-box-containing protein